MEKKTWADFLPPDWLSQIQNLLALRLGEPLDSQRLSYRELEELGRLLRPAWFAIRQLKSAKRRAAARRLGELLSVPDNLVECGALRHMAHKILVDRGDIDAIGPEIAALMRISDSLEEVLGSLQARYGIVFDRWAREQFEEIYHQVKGEIDRPLRRDGRVDALLAFLTDETFAPPEDKDVKTLLKFLAST